MDLQSIISKRRTTKPEDFNGAIILEAIFEEILTAANCKSRSDRAVEIICIR
ncbi:MAG: hypothetical protein IPN09_11390 [Bacteroidetes bacterium]|nr:hypothetical protein [Bacteroidota bacterium]